MMNPYTPGAGMMPSYLAGRDTILENATQYLEAMKHGYPQQSILYYGLRGVGKTVLLNQIEAIAAEMEILYHHIEISEKGNFLRCISTTAKACIHELSVKENLKDSLAKVLGVLRSFTLVYNPDDKTSLSFDFHDPITPTLGTADTGDLFHDLSELLIMLGTLAKKSEQAICFFIDEIQYIKKDEFEALMSALHRVNQLRLPIVIFGAGLPKILKMAGEIKSYSERLFRFIEIERLDEAASLSALVKPAEEVGVRYDYDVQQYILKRTQGYPYFIQEFGNAIFCFLKEKTVTRAVLEVATEQFYKNLDEAFFKVRYERTTKNEKDFMYAMVNCGELPCSTTDIANILKKKVTSISFTRANLIYKGIVYTTGRSEIDFTVPQFDQFLKRMQKKQKET